MIENIDKLHINEKIDCRDLVGKSINSINAKISKDKISLMIDYMNVLLEWNSKINLISRKSEEIVLTNGLIESFALYEFLQNFDGKMLDVGSGGGIPGIFQAILFSDNPAYHFTLIDSIGKKVMVLNDIKDRLKLTNVNIFNTRLEDVKKVCKTKFDIIFSRGVGSFDQMLSSYNKALAEDGVLIFLTGIDQADETCFNGAKILKNPYLNNRLLVVMEKN